MKNIITIIFGILIINILISSCTDDVIDKTPLDSYTDASVWNDLMLAEAFANNL